jgi:transcriptional regulator with XRE-family HTH domain
MLDRRLFIDQFHLGLQTTTLERAVMITAGQLRAARALLRIDQRKLAEQSGLSLPTIQRMEASEGVIRGNVDSLMKLVAALDAAGIELISDNATSSNGGRGVRLKGLPP